ncbi:endo-1,4-beta-xylanase [Sediminitomix flava]|uniref:Beta-xylanase n=1 Tax=Sediminitomix flava TaxID=379075 RepID=A0A315Z943_SEDFL|nr:endo-1,4-beta-xylanase [Sediminitomix flava]PWJ41910.1 endo-1,4-beta-xylanase [Sediminitomix flava]
MKHQLYSMLYLCFLATLVGVVSCQQKETISIQDQIRQSTDKGLKDWGKFPVGGAVNISDVLKDPKLQAITEKNFNSITATNDMKMYGIIPTEGVYYWDKVDTLVSFCEKNNQRLFGHALIWHHGAPQWIKDQTAENGAEWMDSFMKEYIQTVVGRYKGKVAAWDVVNEAFASEGGAYRETLWYNNLGKKYIANAFRYAHEADPEADLFYNDFNIERDAEKLDGVISMITELKAQNVPITGLGFQMHIRIDTPEELIENSLKKAAETGLKIHISELDIIFNKHNDTEGGGEQSITELTEELKQLQAEKYQRIVKIYRKVVPAAQQFGITFWDFTDRDTWIRPFFNLTDWPTVFDEELEPKPAYYSFAEGLVLPLDELEVSQ